MLRFQRRCSQQKWKIYRELKTSLFSQKNLIDHPSSSRAVSQQIQKMNHFPIWWLINCLAICVRDEQKHFVFHQQNPPMPKAPPMVAIGGVSRKSNKVKEDAFLTCCEKGKKSAYHMLWVLSAAPKLKGKLTREVASTIVGKEFSFSIMDLFQVMDTQLRNVDIWVEVLKYFLLDCTVHYLSTHAFDLFSYSI